MHLYHNGMRVQRRRREWGYLFTLLLLFIFSSLIFFTLLHSSILAFWLYVSSIAFIPSFLFRRHSSRVLDSGRSLILESPRYWLRIQILDLQFILPFTAYIPFQKRLPDSI